LYVGTSNFAEFSGNNSLAAETLTLSERPTPFISSTVERIFTDSSDAIYVTGPGASACSGSGTNTVTWFAPFAAGSIDVLTEASSNVVNLQSMDCGTYVTEIQGYSLTANIGNSSDGVQSILGSVGVDQLIDASCNVNVDDSADTGNRPNVTFNGGYLDNLAPAPIHVGESVAGGLFLAINGGKGTNSFTITNTTHSSSVEGSNVSVFPGGGNATVNVQGTSAPLNIYDDGVFDSVHIGSNAPFYGGTLANVFGGVYVGGSGSTALSVDDSGDSTGRAVTLNGTSLSGLSPAAIAWSASPHSSGGVTSLAIDGSGGASSNYSITNTPDLHFTDLNTNSASDVVQVSGTASPLYLYNDGGQDYVLVGNGTLAGINGNVFVSGVGATYLYVEDQTDNTSHAATLTDKELSGLSKGSIFWSASSSTTGGVNFLGIDGSAAASTYTVDNTPNLYYDTYLDLGASGWDVVAIVGTTGRLNVQNGTGAHAAVYVESGTAAGNVNGLVDVYGAGDIYLYVEDFSTASPQTAALIGTSLTGLSKGTIEWTPSPTPTGGVTAVEIYGSSANTTFDVTSIPGTYYGNDIVGGSGTNTLIGPNTTNTWNITGVDAGILNAHLGFTGIRNLVGGTGVDTFKFTAATSRVASINGGGAPVWQGDWLDYTAFPSAVTVNLAAAKATGVTGVVTNMQDVLGSNNGNTLTGDVQGNILIGGAAADTILGGPGPSLLIGGKGNDSVTGGSGGDIIIGGFTTYDQTHNEAALMSILAEWQSSNPYTTRISHLRFGGGLNGSNVLRLGTTVIDDGGTDSLTGGKHIAGALDWFFKGTHDTIHNYELGEQIN
jgi:hypothetical protein